MPPEIGEDCDIFQTPPGEFERRAKFPTVSGESATSSKHWAFSQTSSAQLPVTLPSVVFLSWSHYVHLMSVQKPHARAFYEAEAIRGGWSVRQLDRQISTQFFERTSHSKQQAAMLARGQQAQARGCRLGAR